MLKPRKNKFILGITGGIGSGKSTVAGMFKSRDCLLIDADRLAHGLFSPGSRVYKRIKKSFGPQVFKKNNAIDRKKLAGVVFAKHTALARLNRIVHPELIRLIRHNIRDSKKPIVILDAPLIVEAGLTGLLDKLVVVTAKREQQILRSQKKLGLTRKQVVLRMKSQISQKRKLRFADFIIDNSSQLSKTKEQVFQIRRTLARLARKDFCGLKLKGGSCGKVRY